MFFSNTCSYTKKIGSLFVVLFFMLAIPQSSEALGVGTTPGGATTPTTPTNNTTPGVENFQPLAGIPGLTDVGGSDDQRLTNLLNAGYRLAITLGALAAVFQITYAGFKYLSSGGNHGGLEEAKSTITASLAGLLLILSTVLILETISGQIKLDPLLGAPNASVNGPGTLPTLSLTSSTGANANETCQTNASWDNSLGKCVAFTAIGTQPAYNVPAYAQQCSGGILASDGSCQSCPEGTIFEALPGMSEGQCVRPR